MQINQIKYFLTLCEELNFTSAAKRCSISQPSLTNAIRSLEKELGGPLFVRRPTTRLSTLGEAVRPHLERVIDDIENALTTAKNDHLNGYRHRSGGGTTHRDH